MIILMMKLGTQQLRVRAMLFAAADAAALQRGLRIDAVSQEKHVGNMYPGGIHRGRAFL